MYEIAKVEPSEANLRRYIIAGKLKQQIGLASGLKIICVH